MLTHLPTGTVIICQTEKMYDAALEKESTWKDDVPKELKQEKLKREKERLDSTENKE